MSKEEKIAYRILAAMYPDRKPSEVRQIINEALAKEANPDDVVSEEINKGQFIIELEDGSEEAVKPPLY